jgi:hypothetical protein
MSFCQTRWRPPGKNTRKKEEKKMVQFLRVVYDLSKQNYLHATTTGYWVLVVIGMGKKGGSRVVY